MKNRNISSLSLVLILLFLDSWIDSARTLEEFLQCLQFHTSNTISNVIYTPKNSSYAPLLLSSIQNLRFASPSTPKPTVIVTPLNDSQIQSVILCSKVQGLQIRVRCGGHDYEGLSYVSNMPFVIIDMRNLRSIRVDTNSSSAWVQGGALLGEVYHKIAEKSQTLAFPAGLCPTVGVGGHISGGGVGTLIRKYGLAADNILDARIVNANGEILDRKSMGEDLFWAIRGGGAASFGVILEWKIKLVKVPSTVTVFTVNRTLEHNATKLVHKWQSIAPKLDRNLFIRIVLTRLDNEDGSRTVKASFQSLFLGRVKRLVQLMQKSFPELNLRKEDCFEKSWINAVLYFSELPSGSTLDDLVKRTTSKPQTYYKSKSDYVRKAIPKYALEGLWKRFQADEARKAQLVFHPFGGIMDVISEHELPFPHRAGNLYEIQHLVYWDQKDNAESERYINWLRRLYGFLTPYVSHFPRAQYYNYRDLDLGTNNEGNISYAQARVWGIKYFLNNFDRLVKVKTMIDPSNFFRNKQSIPPDGVTKFC